MEAFSGSGTGYIDEESAFPITPGQLLAILVGWDPYDDVAAFMLCNYSTDTCAEPEPAPQTVYSSGDSVEWILERPGTNCANSICDLYPLYNVGDVTFDEDNYVELTPIGTTMKSDLYDSNNYQLYYMTDCSTGQLLAGPAPAGQYGFDNYWNAYGALNILNYQGGECG